jgi:hypothetical protein
MSAEITLDAARHPHKSPSPLLMRLRVVARRIMIAILLLALVLAGWHVRTNVPYTSDSDLAYYLGLVGGVLMLALLIYPLRKRIRVLRYLGPLRFWFRFHMLAGVLGPALVLFHSTFQVRSFNATIALASMLLVVASGLVGRLLYRRIHRGLYGRRATLDELQQSLDTQLQAMRSSAGLPGEVKQEIEHFAHLVSSVPANRWQRVAHFVTLGYRRRRANQRARRALAKYAGSPCTMTECVPANPAELLRNIDATLVAAQTAAQFSSYERLFSYWHAVHIPFLFMLLITALVHVVAVHAY